MVDGPGDDIRAQLATLLGKPWDSIGQVRKTGETPPRISVIDVAVLITGKDANNAARDVAFVKDRHPEVIQKLNDFRFPGQGQRKTAVTCAQGVVELVLLLPGRMAGRVRAEAARLFARFLGGDLSLIEQICQARGRRRRNRSA